MNIEGTYTLQASPQDVWYCLMDVQVLQSSLPGVKQLERLSEHKHSIILEIKQTPLIGSYHGQVIITEQHYPDYYCIAIEGEGLQSTISGEGTVYLNRHGNNTIVAYKGTLNLGKIATLLPPPVVRGTAKMLIQQFFTTLSDQLRVMQPTQQDDAEESQAAIGVKQGTVESVTAAPLAQATLLEKIVQRLNLGRGEPALEAQWVQRVRRVGFVSGLLVLVWIGTRLPRK